MYLCQVLGRAEFYVLAASRATLFTTDLEHSKAHCHLNTVIQRSDEGFKHVHPTCLSTSTTCGVKLNLVLLSKGE